jgi:hypothetical protein
LQLIIEIENGKKIKDVVKEFGVKQSTLSTLYKNRDSLKRQGNENPTTLIKARRFLAASTHNSIMLLHFSFVQQARDNNMPLSGTLIKKARLYAEAMSVEYFEGSNGWLTKFTKRHGISFKTGCGCPKLDR